MLSYGYSDSLQHAAWVKMSLDKASEKETQIYFMVLVFLLTSLWNMNRSIIWSVWDSELLEVVPKEQATIEDKEMAAGGKKGTAGARKRAPRM